jgi:hypothetical protein
MEELQKIQAELKAPKSQYNKFGNYNYRSSEDILEAVKPLLHKHKCTLTIKDDVVQVGDRIYIKAIVTLKTKDSQEEVTAFAREAQTKKGMDESQITGAASSYARKYALNGLFLIDDTKDADTMDNSVQTAKKPAVSTPQKKQMTDKVMDKIMDKIANGESDVLTNTQKHYMLTAGQHKQILNAQLDYQAKQEENKKS